jgi:uncharacterized protein YbjT (DUF2867 family)
VTGRVLVAGGTGRLGTLVVGRLAARGIEVRVLTRDPSRATHLVDTQVAVVIGDVRDPVCTASAAVGVDVVVSAVHGFAGPGGGSPTSVDRDGNLNLTRAAVAAGAEMVLMSVVGAAPESPFELFRMKYAAEQALQASGPPATIVRSSAFLELWIELLADTAGHRKRPLVFGHGSNPINFVSVRDVAALVDRVVTDSTSRGQTLEIGGPDDLTMDALAELVAPDRCGSRGPRHVPRSALRLLAATVGRLRPELGRQARAALAMDTTDLTFDPNRDVRRHWPDLPCTPSAVVLDELGGPLRAGEGTVSGRW